MKCTTRSWEISHNVKLELAKVGAAIPLDDAFLLSGTALDKLFDIHCTAARPREVCAIKLVNSCKDKPNKGMRALISSRSVLQDALTHWGRVTHICVSKITIIGSDNGLSPGRHQAIIWINDGILLIGLLGTNFSEIYIEILIFSFKKMRLKVSSAKLRPFCLGLHMLNVLDVRRQ